MLHDTYLFENDSVRGLITRIVQPDKAEQFNSFRQKPTSGIILFFFVTTDSAENVLSNI